MTVIQVLIIDKMNELIQQHGKYVEHHNFIFIRTNA